MSAPKPARLSEAQERVMTWLRGGWTAQVESGLSVHINGKRVCNVDTMEALIRRGLVVRSARWTFRAASDATRKATGNG
jgi:hypothetical protein